MQQGPVTEQEAGDNFGMEPAARLAGRSLPFLPISAEDGFYMQFGTKRWEGYGISKIIRSRKGNSSTNCMTILK